jgi:hypothetical protein
MVTLVALVMVDENLPVRTLGDRELPRAISAYRRDRLRTGLACLVRE